MDSVQILDHYRFPLIENHESVQLLAGLLRDGPQTEATLATALHWEVMTVNRCITALYRAALVDRLTADLWAASHLGEQAMDSLGILDLAAIDLAQALAPRSADRLFIKMWMDRPSSEKDSRAYLSLLRSLTQLETLSWETEQDRGKDWTPLIYAILIAADPWAQQAGIENIAEALGAGLQSHLPFSPSTSLDETDVDYQSVASAWRDGMHKYRDSNRLLLFIPHEPSPSTDEDTVRLTWLRALDASLGAKADGGFAASCRLWRRDDASVFWRIMFKRQSLKQYTRTLFERWTGLTDRTEEALLADLTERLLKVVAKAAPMGTPAPIDHTAGNNPDDFETLVSMMQVTSQHVRHHGIHVVPERSQDALRNAAKELSEVLAQSSESELTQKRPSK